MRELKYRADIDGLRAIAVLLVIFYHVGFDFFSGGFIGVDVFFVISGYLITSIIKNEIELNQFSFSAFYARRIKRIIPGLFFVMVVTSIVSVFNLFPDDFISYAESLKYTSLSISNYFFIKHSSDYFAQSVEQLPLLHTWSLSVEEQFYIIWPIVLLLSVRLLKGCFNLAKTIAVIFLIISCIYSSYLVHVWPAAAYYSIGSRAFELLVGCSIALTDIKLARSRWLNSLMSVISLLIIVVTAVIFNKNSSFPGYLALIPSAFAAVFIITGSGSQGLANKIISNRVSVYIGKISYPLYLWHWPIIAFINYREIEKTHLVSILIIFVTFALSIFTYHCIEKPVKKLVKNNISSCIVLIFAPMLISSLVFSYVVVKNRGFDSRIQSVKEYLSPENNPGITHRRCYNSYDLSSRGLCKLGVESGERVGMFIGDSMAGHYMAFLDVLAKDAGIKVLGTAASGIPPVYAVKSHTDSAAQRTPEKLAYNIERLQEAKKYDFVVLAGSWGNGYPYFESDVALNEVVKDFVKNGVKVYILSRPNAIDESVLKRARLAITGKEAVYHIIVPYRTGINVRMDSVRESSMVTFIDPNKTLCVDGKCDISINGQLIYVDTDHITEFGSIELAKRYLKHHSNPFK